MTGPNTSTTIIEQAREQLRATRAAGHYIDWDHEKNAPDIEGADGVILEGFFTWVDLEALLALRKAAAASLHPDLIKEVVARLRDTRAAGCSIDWNCATDEPNIKGADGIEICGLISDADVGALLIVSGIGPGELPFRMSDEEALRRLRRSRAQGLRIEWDQELDAPDLAGKDRIAVAGHFTLDDLLALHWMFLRVHEWASLHEWTSPPAWIRGSR